MDAGYLKEHVGDCLKKCLAEVAEKRPQDPIEFIALWLYKHKINMLYEAQKIAEAEQLIQERKDYELELERQELLKEEAIQLAEIEAEKRKLRAEEEKRQREAALASKLVTLQEKEEPVEPVEPVESVEPVDLGEAAASENEGKDETATEDLPAAEVTEGETETAVEEEEPAEAGEATEES